MSKTRAASKKRDRVRRRLDSAAALRRNSAGPARTEIQIGVSSWLAVWNRRRVHVRTCRLAWLQRPPGNRIAPDPGILTRARHPDGLLLIFPKIYLFLLEVAFPSGAC